MKLREYFYMLGFKPKTRSYGYEEREQQLEGQTVRYAQWMHPKAYPVAVQQKELQRIRQYLQPGDVAIDIGAHAGDTMLPMALAAGKTGAVVCFEANPLVFPTLDYNAGANPDLTTIHAHNVAITETEGPFEFSSNDPGFNNGGTTSRTNKFRRGDVFRMEVPGVRLDGFMQQHHPELVDKLRFIKIDTEGYDLYILRAIADLLQRTRPVVQAEVLHLTP
ncbi:MAG: FkbM family methyltransferase, partial [Planctomycetota bacterium]